LSGFVAQLTRILQVAADPDSDPFAGPNSRRTSGGGAAGHRARARRRRQLLHHLSPLNAPGELLRALPACGVSSLIPHRALREPESDYW